MKRLPLAPLALALLALVASRSGAQDFALPLPPGPAASPLALLDRALPSAAGGAVAAGATTQWLGLPDLVTRALALGLAWRGARVAAGLSQTGDPELGWTGLGLALGGAGQSCGAALRAVARRDRLPGPEPGPLGPGVGIEAGAGAWVEAAAGLRVWGSAPQLWRRGAAAPLARGLETGAAYRDRGVEAWLARRVVRDRDEPAGHELGLGLEYETTTLWARARDRPLRGGLGLAACFRRLEVALEVESHPVLGETVALSISARFAEGFP